MRVNDLTLTHTPPPPAKQQNQHNADKLPPQGHIVSCYGFFGGPGKRSRDVPKTT